MVVRYHQGMHCRLQAYPSSAVADASDGPAPEPDADPVGAVQADGADTAFDDAGPDAGAPDAADPATSALPPQLNQDERLAFPDCSAPGLSQEDPLTIQCASETQKVTLVSGCL